jgi:hypothetical protein
MKFCAKRAKVNSFTHFELAISVLFDTYRAGNYLIDFNLKLQNRSFPIDRQFCSLFLESIKAHILNYPSAKFYQIEIPHLKDICSEDYFQGIEQISQISFGFNLRIDSSNARLFFILSIILKIPKILQICKHFIKTDDIQAMQILSANHFLIKSDPIYFQFETINHFQISRSETEIDLIFHPNKTQIFQQTHQDLSQTINKNQPDSSFKTPFKIEELHENKDKKFHLLKEISTPIQTNISYEELNREYNELLTQYSQRKDQIAFSSKKYKRN